MSKKPDINILLTLLIILSVVAFTRTFLYLLFDKEFLNSGKHLGLNIDLIMEGVLTIFAFFLHLLMHQLLAESSIKLLDHSLKATKYPSESSPKLPEYSSKTTKTSPDSSPKLLEHSPKHPENPSPKTLPKPC